MRGHIYTDSKAQRRRRRRKKRKRRKKAFSGANAVNEEDPERDHATGRRRRRCKKPEVLFGAEQPC